MDRLLFGTGGTPHSSKSSSTIDGIKRIAELGLGCMELEFVQGVRMSEATAREVSKVAKELDIKLSAHAPYFINLNAREPEKVKASQTRLLQTARIGSICGAQSIAVHTAFYMNDPPQTVYARTKERLKEVLDQLKKEDNHVLIRPELMGRESQFGTLEELMDLATELEGIAPCIDVAHWHARTKAFNTYPEFSDFFKRIEERLGRPALDDMHIHFSGIKYGAHGEIEHLNLKESDFNYVDLVKALKDQKVKGLVICESHNLEEDALLLQNTYTRLAGKG